MKQTKTENWIFTSYDKKDKVIESFEIKDRTQSEATNEAIHYVESHQEIADWTLQIAPASKEPNTVGGDGLPEVNAEQIVDNIYKTYGSDSGVLFGIKDRNIVKAIVEFTINRIQNNK